MKPTQWIDHSLDAVSRRMDQGREIMDATRHRLDQGKRLTYAAGGTGMVLAGIRRRSIPGFAMALVGCDLVCRGLTGDSLLHLKSSGLLPNGATDGRPRYGYGVKVQESTVIHQSPEVLYRFLRNPRNVLGLIDRIDSIELDGEYSRWRVRDTKGRVREWYGEIIADRENELIGWRTVEGGAVDHAGSIRFEPSGPRHPGAWRWGRRKGPRASATRMTMSLQYNPRFGTAADSLARLFGADPATWIRGEFARFRDFAESNDLETIEGLLETARSTR